MAFPLGSAFSRGVSSQVSLPGLNASVCIYDNGTDVCDKGHKLKEAGSCTNQNIGTFNSTDALFQLTNTICTEDFYSQTGCSSKVFSSGEISSSVTYLDYLYSNTSSLTQVDSIPYKQSTNKFISSEKVDLQSFYKFVSVDSNTQNYYTLITKDNSIYSFYSMFTLNAGKFLQGPGIYYEFFKYDILSSLIENSYSNTLSVFANYSAYTNLKEIDSSSSFINEGVGTTVSGGIVICEGDFTPPNVNYVSPSSSGTTLRRQNQIVEFELFDLRSGVDLTSIEVVLTSSDRASIPLVFSGVDQTAGDVDITGNPSNYHIRYTPGFSWNDNEKLIVTISGSDLPILVDGLPFTCSGGGINHFSGDIKFSILNDSNLTGDLNAIGDVDPPVITFTSFVENSTNNSIFSPLVIHLEDYLTTIDITTINLYIAGEAVILAGVPLKVNTSVTGNPSQYVLSYLPENNFIYGATYGVLVEASDKATPASNDLSHSFNIGFINDSSIVISNFKPEIGITTGLQDVDISVDIQDILYDINSITSFMSINGEVVPATITPIADGINLTYHPPNNFNYDAPIIVRVRGVNNNATLTIREEVYTLYFGCRYLFRNKGKYKYDSKVDVVIKASNTGRLSRNLNYNYLFSTYAKPTDNLTASIVAINPVDNLTASILPQGPFHYYGEDVVVTFYVKDFEGNELGPITYSYTIEQKPII